MNLIAYPLLASLLATAASAKDDIITFSTHSAQDLVESYFRDSDGQIQFRNIAASSHSCFALFANGHSAGRHKDTNEFLLPNEGIILSTGNPQDFHTNDSDETSTNFGITTGDINLEHELPPYTQVLDPCFIQFEFSCPEETDVYTPVIRFDYVFGSEEYYKQQTDTSFNDVFDEHNEVVSVSINNVNEQQNSNYFINNKMEGRINATSPYNAVEADGFTIKLTARGVPRPGWNIIKLAIGDASDGNLDSWVLLEAGTFSCAPMPTTTAKPSSASITTLSPSMAPTPNPSQSLLRSSSSSPTLNKNLKLPSSPDPGTARKQQSKARIPKPIAITLMACVGLFALVIPTIAYFVTR
ncbi:choice-of-anchor L domain-containing protein [Skeletonema marinoi]|uniref:Choice-of-anchor L domain-containing protein n=1 Tax=Skeletonema marinoi TaxID=267567 RepID=A0AAD9DGV1_9STRA|nr:choice-of-anchor L domain-containing protein [Skeletonema marinoi]